MIVDWDHVCAFPDYEGYITAKQEHLEVVLLVPNPFAYNFDAADSGIEPTVVLRNNGDLPDVVFKAQAVSLIQDMSNLVPVAAWDDDPAVLEVYRAAGVPFTSDLSWNQEEF